MNQFQLLGAIEMGLIYSIVTIGVYITFKVINFPDLTVDGSFTLGAAIFGTMFVNGFPVQICAFGTIISGFAAGVLTGYLHVVWKIQGILSAILVMSGLYSANLRIMGRPNLSIMTESSTFWSVDIFLATTVLFVIIILNRFFISNYGMAIRATGIGEKASAAYGVNTGMAKIIALGISNSVVASSGMMFAKSQGFVDIAMGSGTVLTGLASFIIGETIMRPKKTLTYLIACVVGSVIYRIMMSLALNVHDLGMQPSDLNLVTSLFVIATILIKKNN